MYNDLFNLSIYLSIYIYMHCAQSIWVCRTVCGNIGKLGVRRSAARLGGVGGGGGGERAGGGAFLSRRKVTESAARRWLELADDGKTSVVIMSLVPSSISGRLRHALASQQPLLSIGWLVRIV